MKKIFNKPEQKIIRQKLRNELSSVELKLWYYIRNRQVKGFKFRRQYGIDNIIVDFYCTELKLVLEVDGESHYRSQVEMGRDVKRDLFLKTLNIDTLRFTNLDIVENLEGVMEKLYKFVELKSNNLNLTPSNSPLKGGETNCLV